MFKGDTEEAIGEGEGLYGVTEGATAAGGSTGPPTRSDINKTADGNEGKKIGGWLGAVRKGWNTGWEMIMRWRTKWWLIFLVGVCSMNYIIWRYRHKKNEVL